MNVLFIMSDNHNPLFTGTYGGITRTPNLDALAARGARFDSAYCSSPLCGPSRGSLFAGKAANEIRAWSNAFPWDGSVRGWPDVLRGAGVKLTAIGKLHFKNHADTGIEEELHTHHIPDRPDPVSLYREQEVVRWAKTYVRSWWNSEPRDDDAPLPNEPERTDLAIDWLRCHRSSDRPWMLYVGYAKPHPPWTTRRSLFEHYHSRIPPLSPKYLQPVEDLHPVDQLQAVHTCAYDRDADEVRRLHACYHGMVEEVDGEIGRLLGTLDELSLREDTLVIYTSDHGEMARAHGKWSKLSLYEDSIRVPLIMAGPGVRPGTVVRDPVSLLDVFPSIADHLELPGQPDRRGRSLLPVARGEPDPLGDTPVVSEIHANGWPCSGFAVRQGPWKLMEYIGFRPALYNLDEDPDEMTDLVKTRGEEDPLVAQTLVRLRAALAAVCDPAELDREAKADQRRIREEAAQSGNLADWLWSRGFERNTDRLIPRPEFEEQGNAMRCRPSP